MTVLLADTDEYRIRFHQAGTVLDIALRGHWTDASVRRYNAAIAEATNRIVARYCLRGRQAVLVDVTGFAVQSPSVLDALAAAAVDKATAGRRTALLLSSALLTMQAKRATPHYTMFEDRNAAMAWLLEGA